MRILFVASMYPHPGMPYSGTFIRKCVLAANRMGHKIVGLVPKPHFPIPSALYPRLKTYRQIPKYSDIDGFPVHRPNQWQVPMIAVDWQQHQGSYLQMRGTCKRLHDEHKFDAILSFNLLSAGGLAWRLGKMLGIPSAGWAFGTDVRVRHQSAAAQSLRETIEELDVVFYQSSELRDCGASYLPTPSALNLDRHVVLPHGIPKLDRAAPDAGAQIRKQHGIPDDAVLALFLSRVVKDKGIFELAEAFKLARNAGVDLYCIAVGWSPGFDDGEKLRQELAREKLTDRFKLLPACKPEQVPEFHAAADMFVFPSYNEGMPNALLEAMQLETPAIAFDIPPILDIQAHGECLKLVPQLDASALGDAIVAISKDTELRKRLVTEASRVVAQEFDVTVNMERAMSQISDQL